jgi:dihydrodipicolinate synthase/N-acetylneuraminate lyase
MESYLSGDKDTAERLSAVIRGLNQIVHTPAYAYPRSLKPVLNHLGFPMGSIRRPYLPPPAEQQEEMCRRVDELHLEQYEDLPTATTV